MRKVLIVSPHFPPINAPDHQRVRMSLPYFRRYGWEPYVLAVRPDCVEGVHDTLLEKMVPDDVPVTRTGALPVNQTRAVGLGSLSLRCLPHMLAAGSGIIAREKIDLVYFSTTMFPVMALGRRWLSRFGVPYVLDFQDPWLNDYYERPGAPPPPGGRLKYGVARTLARVLEPYTMRRVRHSISVSPAYPSTLMGRYSWLRENQFTVLPFGAAEKDFESLPSLGVKQTIFTPGDGRRHYVYVGRGGGDMEKALRILFLGIRSDREKHGGRWEKVRLHFVGTTYAMGERAAKSVEPVAAACGVADLVEEHAYRIPYFEALQVLADSDGIILV
ncbi:MAG TPA: glycosyltransferase, partial [Blastocatellia bacterium]|nr:glycosyltransferase [Blastocatellia bacterium]